MFYFYTDKKGVLSVENNTVRLRSKRIFADLTTASKKSHKRLLVIDTGAIPAAETDIRSAEESIREAMKGEVSADIVIPVRSIRNLSPYYPPDEVLAGGGLVTKMKKGTLRLLVIFRKEMWDLPKGKLDEGETIEHCARREVMEETGIQNLTVVQPLGFTVHGYIQNNRFKVKKTSWYQMHTTDTEFSPQEEEAIEIVRWMKWEKAESEISYPMYKHLLARTRPLVEAQSSL